MTGTPENLEPETNNHLLYELLYVVLFGNKLKIKLIKKMI